MYLTLHLSIYHDYISILTHSSTYWGINAAAADSQFPRDGRRFNRTETVFPTYASMKKKKRGEWERVCVHEWEREESVCVCVCLSERERESSETWEVVSLVTKVFYLSLLCAYAKCECEFFLFGPLYKSIFLFIWFIIGYFPWRPLKAPPANPRT